MSNQGRKYGKALVTGGCGFIGTNLVNRLVEDGVKVKVLDVAAVEGLVDSRGVRYFHGDMSSREVLASAVDDVDVVYHLAWSTIPQTSNEDPIFDVSSNVSGTLKLLDACVGKDVKKVVFLSSGGTIYGRCASLPIDEESPLEPTSSYGITKLTVEKYLALYRSLHGLEYIVLRPSNPYGPFQNPLGRVGTVAVFMHRAISGSPIRIWGDGGVIRDYIFIADLVAAIKMAGEAGPVVDKIFNISSGEGRSLLELLEMVTAVVGKRPEVVFEPSRVFDVPANVLDNSRAKELLGWYPAVPFEAGLEKTYAWMKVWMAGL